MIINDNSYVEFNSYLSVDIIKIQKNEEDGKLTSYEEAVKDDIREKVNTNTVLFTTFGEITGTSTSEKSVQAYYFDPEGSLSNATISIFRKTPQQKYYDFICTLDNKGFNMADYNVLNDHYYHYMASAIVDTGIEPRPDSGDLPRIRYYVYENKDKYGNDIYIKTTFDTWSICDLEETDEEHIYQVTDHTWKLGLNIESENVTRNVGINSWDTLGKYPKQAYGQKNYDSSQFTGLLGSFEEYNVYDLSHPYDEEFIENYGEDKSVYVDNPAEYYPSVQKYQYTEQENFSKSHGTDTEKLMSWNDFVSNGKLKLLRDLKGNAWIIQIVDSISYDINNQSNYKQTTISFSWKEVEDINMSSIIGTL